MGMHFVHKNFEYGSNYGHVFSVSRPLIRMCDAY